VDTFGNDIPYNDLRLKIDFFYLVNQEIFKVLKLFASQSNFLSSIKTAWLEELGILKVY
jgi:hypothetical protein